jgi:hypothetical protein
MRVCTGVQFVSTMVRGLLILGSTKNHHVNLGAPQAQPALQHESETEMYL